MRKIILSFTLICYVLFGSAPALANADSNMTSFWNNSLASSNAVGPTAYQGQEAGYYTLGNYSYRAPEETSNIASVTLPSVKGGCGGVDIFGGSFSMINGDQLIALFKATAQNAVGLLFQMAVKTLSELLGNEIEQMFSIVQKANLGSRSSCELAQLGINTAVSLLPQSTLKSCIEIGMANGKYVDEAAAREACGFGGNAESDVHNASATEKANQPIDRNLAWEALQKHALFSGDNQLSELMMTLTGTVTVFVDSHNNSEEMVIPGAATRDGMITALLDGGTNVRVHKCLDANCYSFTPYGDSITVTGFKSRVDTLVQSIVGKIIAKQPLSSSEIDFLGLSTIPLYKIASVQVAANGALASNEMKQYSDALAADILIGWMQSNIMQVQETAVNMQGISAADMATWQGGIRDIMERLDARRQANYAKIQSVNSLIDRTRTVENEIAVNTTTRLAQSIVYVQSRHAE